MNSKRQNKKIIIGMSGGVDSSVAAFLLKQEGYQVEGLFMKNWEADDDEFCTAEQDLLDAKSVAMKINIPLHVVNFSQTYWDKVFQYFLNEYQSGRTPNPDVLCNKEIKFKAFLEYALTLGADAIATGHYARLSENTEYGMQLLKAKDDSKDQTYFLHALNQHQLTHSIFPLGCYKKEDVRKIAESQDFINHDKKDSTGICFIGERKFKNFLQEYLLIQPGPIKHWDSKQTIGTHDGLMFYTIGQRKGLKIGGVKNQKEAAWYVSKKEIPTNTLWVVQNHEHPTLLCKKLLCKNTHWISEKNIPETCFAKTRYRQSEAFCSIRHIENSAYEITFEKPQWAVTPGQFIVFYQGDVCLGGGEIDQILSS